MAKLRLFSDFFVKKMKIIIQFCGRTEQIRSEMSPFLKSASKSVLIHQNRIQENRADHTFLIFYKGNVMRVCKFSHCVLALQKFAKVYF